MEKRLNELQNDLIEAEESNIKLFKLADQRFELANVIIESTNNKIELLIKRIDHQDASIKELRTYCESLECEIEELKKS